MCSLIQSFPRKNSRLLMAAIAAISVSALSGCGYFQNRHHITVGSIPDDYRTNHPIVLSEHEEALDIPVGTSDTRVSDAQRSSIQGFVAPYLSNGSGIVQVLLPAGAVNTAASKRVLPHILDALRSAGVPRGNLVSSSYAAEGIEGAAPVRISYRAMAAATEPCGKWPKDIGDTVDNKHYDNYGCASQNNIASMVANPADLLGPRQLGPVDAGKRTAAINSYQKSTGTWSADTNYTW